VHARYDDRDPHARRRVRARASGSTLYEEFHPFGTTSYAAKDSAVEVSAKRYRYIGKERDEETGLYHCGARYLAAWLGRWTAADPIGLGDGVNRYAYARGNPVRLVDPGGTKAADPDALTPEQHADVQRAMDLLAET
jgi:RHS repeat-associated protein